MDYLLVSSLGSKVFFVNMNSFFFMPVQSPSPLFVNHPSNNVHCVVIHLTLVWLCVYGRVYPQIHTKTDPCTSDGILDPQMHNSAIMFRHVLLLLPSSLDAVRRQATQPLPYRLAANTVAHARVRGDRLEDPAANGRRWVGANQPHTPRDTDTNSGFGNSIFSPYTLDWPQIFARWVMTHYRVFLLDHVDRILHAEVACAETDDEIIKAARERHPRSKLEIWEDGRRVTIVALGKTVLPF